MCYTICMANVKNILYIHGLGGSKDSTTCKNLREILPDCTIYADDFDLFDVAGTQKKIETLIEKHEIGTLIGSSFGAFYVLARKGMPFRIVINPCMKPSIEIPKLDPTIPEKTLEELQKQEAIVYSKTTSVSKTTTFGIFGLCDELFSYRNFFAETYEKKFDIPLVFTAEGFNENDSDEPEEKSDFHILTVEGAGHKMTKEQLSFPVLKAFEAVKKLANADDKIRKNYETFPIEVKLGECVDPILPLEEADNFERHILERKNRRERHLNRIRKMNQTWRKKWRKNEQK